jgi:outer membrane immunogenic protein
MEGQMGCKFWGGLGLLASILAGTAAAGAADLAAKAPPVYKAPPAILSDWAGSYIGIHGGYGFGSTSFDAPFSFANVAPKGGIFGGHAGYNWQYGSVVGGLELDFDGADINASNTVASSPLTGIRAGIATAGVENKFDELATARARLGYAVLPNVLAYGTGGAAWGHSALTGSVNAPAGSLSADANANNFGWTGGGGLEYKLWGNFIARAEYLHYDFAKTAYSFPILFSPNAATSLDVVRGGLSFKF